MPSPPSGYTTRPPRGDSTLLSSRRRSVLYVYAEQNTSRLSTEGMSRADRPTVRGLSGECAAAWLRGARGSHYRYRVGGVVAG